MKPSILGSWNHPLPLKWIATSMHDLLLYVVPWSSDVAAREARTVYIERDNAYTQVLSRSTETGTRIETSQVAESRNRPYSSKRL